MNKYQTNFQYNPIYLMLILVVFISYTFNLKIWKTVLFLLFLLFGYISLVIFALVASAQGAPNGVNPFGVPIVPPEKRDDAKKKKE